MDGCPAPFAARILSSDPPPPILLAASESSPLVINLFYDQDVTVIPGAALDAWTIRIDGIRRGAVSLINLTATTLRVVAGTTGLPIGGRFVTYITGTDSVQGATGVAAANAINVPIAP